jgi:nucleoside-diphosphate kinase
MPIEKTYVMLKPGVLQRRLAGEIIARIERKGLNIVAMKMMNIPRELAATHYAEHRGKDYYDPLLTFISSGPVVAMVIEGEGAIARLRSLCGATNVEAALPGTIRGDFAMHTRLNLIHASDSPDSAAREIGLFFRDEELCPWKDGNDAWF